MALQRRQLIQAAGAATFVGALPAFAQARTKVKVATCTARRRRPYLAGPQMAHSQAGLELN